MMSYINSSSVVYLGREDTLHPIPVPRINTSPAAVKRPVAKPRSLTDLIIVENIPHQEDEADLLEYLELFCGVNCSISERKGSGAAVIRFDDKIGNDAYLNV